MRKILLYTLFIYTTTSYAQLGIGTTNPQAELHLSGASSTIRIESLNSVNNPVLNDGSKIVPAFVDGNGDLSLGVGHGSSSAEPLNFLIDVPNFIPDDPYSIGFDTGTVVNSNDTGETSVEGELVRISLTVPQNATVEVKYGITLLITGSDMSIGPPFVYATYDQAVSMQTYFCVDIDSDGLDATEKARRHGYKGQSYETNYGGTVGYPYMNSQGYLTLPAGSHELYFFGIVEDAPLSYTSVGFGGDKDYLKIRVYN